MRCSVCVVCGGGGVCGVYTLIGLVTVLLSVASTARVMLPGTTRGSGLRLMDWTLATSDEEPHDDHEKLSKFSGWST